MDKILRIDVGTEGGPKMKETPLGEYAGLGGRALTSAIVSREVPPLCHPLGAENKLVIAPGLLSGTGAAMSSRISVGCKSPLTGGIKEANAGGQPSQVLGRLGYAAIVLEGKPKDDTLYKVMINKDGVKITADNSLKMMTNYDLIEKMKKEHGDKIACISIGPAGSAPTAKVCSLPFSSATICWAILLPTIGSESSILSSPSSIAAAIVAIGMFSDRRPFFIPIPLTLV